MTSSFPPVAQATHKHTENRQDIPAETKENPAKATPTNSGNDAGLPKGPAIEPVYGGKSKRGHRKIQGA